MAAQEDLCGLPPLQEGMLVTVMSGPFRMRVLDVRRMRVRGVLRTQLFAVTGMMVPAVIRVLCMTRM